MESVGSDYERREDFTEFLEGAARGKRGESVFPLSNRSMLQKSPFMCL